MNVLLLLIPAALLLGLLGLGAFLWALRSGQFEDLDGARHRILVDDEDEDEDGERERTGGQAGRMPRSSADRTSPPTPTTSR